MEDSKLENVIRKLSILFGTALLLASIYLSYDGFDQSVTGGNGSYTMLAKGIGIAIAVTFTILEFIVSSRNEGLNSTLKALGIFAYGYSIYTNFLGAEHLLQMDKGMAAIVATFMDVVPEPMIAWGLGEAIVGDLLGNLGKFATEPIGKPKKHNEQKHQGQQSQQGQQGHGGGNQHRRSEDGNGHKPQLSPEMMERLRQNQKNQQFHQVHGSNGNNRENRQDSDKFRR